MMNVATPASAPLPTHFAPPARMPSTRRQLYHHPTLHMRSGSNSNSPRFLASEFAPPASPNINPNYSPPSAQQTLPRSTSSQSAYSGTQAYIVPAPLQPQGSSPQQQPLQPRRSLQRQPTTGSGNSLNQYFQPSPQNVLSGHRKQAASTSTSNSSITRMPSGPSQYLVSTPPQVRPMSASISPADSYVARLRRAKATVWSARGQREDLDRSNSKDDKYKKAAKNRVASSKHKLTSGVYTYENTGLPAHPRQLMPRLSANEAEDSDYMDPFISGPNFFDTTAASSKGSIKTKTTTSSTSPAASAQNVPSLLNTTPTGTPATEIKSPFDSVEDGRGSPEPLQNYYKPPNRRESKRISRFIDDDDVGLNDRQVGGERRLFVVNASPSESEDES